MALLLILNCSMLYNFSNCRILSGGSFWKNFRSVKVLRLGFWFPVIEMRQSEHKAGLIIDTKTRNCL